jgi:PAP2 superfamily.
MTGYYRNTLAGREKITPGWILYRIRRVPPVYWLLPLVAAIALFSATVPYSFWVHFRSIFRARSLLVNMLLLFGLIAVSLIWTTGQTIDAAVFAFFNRRGRRPVWLDRTMRTITEFGNGIVTLAIAVTLYFFVNHHLAYEFIFGTLVMWLIVELLKVIIRRARPFAKLTGVRVVGTRARGHSFPSGHTSQAFYTATIFINYFHAVPGTAFLLYLAALLVGITRMYMGMHYPRDVLAGAILGTCWGLIGAAMNSFIF